jgi:beta-lactamase superfamily II metal-dependent hydrolase
MTKKMRNVLALAAVLAFACALAAAPKELNIYWLDMEGGASTLIVAPSGESLLIDTGIPDEQEVKRIADLATNVAHLKKLDYVLITHYHGDHVGGVPALSKMIPIGRYLDHGDLTLETEKPRQMKVWNDYQAIANGNRTTLKPGDAIPLKGVRITVVSSAGVAITKPINGGGGPNPLCTDALQKKPDQDPENGSSVGTLLTYGKFRFLDLGDLPWYQEQLLACPVNLLGHVDIYQTTHHGLERSGSPQLVWALHPRVAVMNNGPTRGDAVTFQTLKKSADLEDLWQIHLALKQDRAIQTSDDMIANLDASDQCKGNWIRATVKPDGTYTVTNSRNNFTKTYTAR